MSSLYPLLLLAPQRSPPLAQVVVEDVEENGPFSAPSGGVKIVLQTVDDRTPKDPSKATSGAVRGNVIDGGIHVDAI